MLFINGRNFVILQAWPGNPNYTLRGRGSPRRCSALWSRGDTHQDELMGALPSVWTTFQTQGVTAQVYGTHYGMQVKSISGLYKTHYGMLRWRTKGMDLGDLGTSMRKQRENGIKGVGRLYTGCWSVHLHDYAWCLISAVCLIKFPFYFSVLCACVCNGLSANNWSGIKGERPVCLWCQQLEGVQVCEWVCQH